jgi:hypothetical protein
MRLPNTRDDERFFFSRVRPEIWFLGQLRVWRLFIRLTWWGPWPFISLVLAWKRKDKKPWGLQAYLGLKEDGTKTWEYRQTVITYTLKELASARGIELDEWPVENNMAGG